MLLWMALRLHYPLLLHTTSVFSVHYALLYRVISFLVYFIQVKLPLKLRLKLIVMISLSIHMMTSQGHMSVRCVINGLEQSNN